MLSDEPFCGATWDFARQFGWGQHIYEEYPRMVLHIVPLLQVTLFRKVSFSEDLERGQNSLQDPFEPINIVESLVSLFVRHNFSGVAQVGLSTTNMGDAYWVHAPVYPNRKSQKF